MFIALCFKGFTLEDFIANINKNQHILKLNIYQEFKTGIHVGKNLHEIRDVLRAQLNVTERQLRDDQGTIL